MSVTYFTSIDKTEDPGYNIWSDLNYGHRRSMILRRDPEKRLGMLAIIDSLRGEKVNYMHAWTISSGVIKRVKGTKIFIADGYKLRRLDICLTYVSHPSVVAYINMFGDPDITFSPIV